MPRAGAHSVSTTHEWLRTGTSAAHEKIEALSPLSLLLEGKMADSASYGNLLAGLLNLMDQIEDIAEQTVFSSSLLEADGALREELQQAFFLCRREMLRNDLQALGASCCPPNQRLALLRETFLEGSKSMRWGLAYVLVGQSLGSAQIHRILSSPGHPLPRTLGHVPTEPGLMEQAPYSFLWGYGRKTSRLWSQFLRMLEQEVPFEGPPMDRVQALEGAHLAFKAFETLWTPEMHTTLPTHALPEPQEPMDSSI